MQMKFKDMTDNEMFSFINDRMTRLIGMISGDVHDLQSTMLDIQKDFIDCGGIADPNPVSLDELMEYAINPRKNVSSIRDGYNIFVSKFLSVCKSVLKFNHSKMN
jgi:hypothetical protein